MNEFKILRLDEMKNQSIDSLIELYRNGYRLENAGDNDIYPTYPAIESMATCPTASKYVNQTVTITATPSGGTAPYTVDIRKDATVIRQFTGVLANQTVSHTYTLVSTDVGTHSFGAIAYDSCPTASGGPKASLLDVCNVTVVACPTISVPSMTLSSTTVPQNSNLTFNMSWTGGLSPYRIVLYLDGGTVGFYDSGYSITGTTHSTTRLVNWTVAPHTVQAQLHDGCNTPTLSTLQTVNVTAPCPILVAPTVSCPTTNVTQGATATFGASWSGGLAPFTIGWYKDTDTMSFASTVVTTGTTASVTAPVNWTVGSHTVKATVSDSCSPVPQMLTSPVTCSVNVVTACTIPSISVTVA